MSTEYLPKSSIIGLPTSISSDLFYRIVSLRSTTFISAVIALYLAVVLAFGLLYWVSGSNECITEVGSAVRHETA